MSKEELKREIKLLLFLNKLMPDCVIYNGVEPTYIIVENYIKGRMLTAGLGSIIDCPNIHRVIKTKHARCMKPMHILEILDSEVINDDLG